MKKYDKAGLQQCLINLSQKLGKKHLSKLDVDMNSNMPSSSTYTRYFGSWEKALDSVELKTGIITGRPCNPPIYISRKSLDIINGELLGDGSLSLTGSYRSNACFSHSTANLSYGNFLYDRLLHNNIPLLKKEICKARNGGGEQFRTRTTTNLSWTALYHKWYKNKKKILPDDICLNKDVCLHWYLGDGYFEHGTCKISTCNFSYEEVKTLSRILTGLGFKANPNKRSGGYYVIRFSKYSCQSFLEWIGDCPVEGYRHRWGIDE